ncbi:MAG: cell envelope integrity EipB family protein [Acetobacteraceae bacterium]
MRPLALSAAVLALVASASLPAAADGLNTTSAAHRAIYELTRSSSRGGDIIAAKGTMGYEVIDACDGWAVRQRLSMVLTNSDGQDIQMVSDYATWESKDGLKFRFHMKQTTDTAVTSQTDGDATLERPGGPGVAHYTVPDDTTKPLPEGTLFPMAHTSAIIAAAQAGKRFLTIPLFDGTDDGGAEDSTLVVLDWKKPEANKYPLLSSLPSTRVRLAFFDRESKSEVPTYQVGMRYWENGVADNLQMDFGDFVMDAKITELTPLPHKC